jgi:hypothetical protein
LSGNNGFFIHILKHASALKSQLTRCSSTILLRSGAMIQSREICSSSAVGISRGNCFANGVCNGSGVFPLYHVPQFHVSTAVPRSTSHTTGLHHTAVPLHILSIVAFNTSSVQSFNSSYICTAFTMRQSETCNSAYGLFLVTGALLVV